MKSTCKIIKNMNNNKINEIRTQLKCWLRIMPKTNSYLGSNNTLNKIYNINNIIHSIYTNILQRKIPCVSENNCTNFNRIIHLKILMSF